jgi:hypothetical protein
MSMDSKLRFYKNDVNLFIITSHALYHPTMHVLYEYVDVYVFANACISFVTAGCVSIIDAFNQALGRQHIQGGKYSTRDSSRRIDSITPQLVQRPPLEEVSWCLSWYR